MTRSLPPGLGIISTCRNLPVSWRSWCGFPTWMEFWGRGRTYSCICIRRVLTINVGSNKTAAITIAGATTQDMATQINQALQTAGISGVSAVVDATTGTTIDLQGASTFTNTFVSGGGALGATPTTALAGGDPNAAINAIAQAVQSLGSVQGVVGAGENTLNYAINLAQ